MWGKIHSLVCSFSDIFLIKEQGSCQFFRYFFNKGTRFRSLKKYTSFKLLHNSALHAEARETQLTQPKASKLK
jgi:hypothetical protein